ncbi:MAG: hypothetical protein ACKVH1_18125 [Alphaproteobacteria bacterium]
MKLQTLAIAASMLLLSGCATYSHSDVKPQGAAASSSGATASKPAPTNPAEIIVTEGDITDRKYEVLADITATVNKTTIFHPDPTPKLVEEKLRAEAAKLGADAVVLVRYGDVGVSVLSWGSIDGKSRAVRFVR